MRDYDLAVAAIPENFRFGIESEHSVAGQRWLAQLSRLLGTLCRQWNLEIANATPRHGYQSLVWRVKRGTDDFALKLTIPREAFTREITGLLAWDGHGMVKLHRHDLELGGALLDWLDASHSLADLPISEALPIAGRMLAVNPEVARKSSALFSNSFKAALTTRRGWARRNRALDAPLTLSAIEAGSAAITRTTQRPRNDHPRLVNHDLHYGNVIRDWNESWVCIDPKPVIGVPEYALAPLIWRRYKNPEDALNRVQELCTLAELNTPLALDWLLIRAIEYFYWGLGVGLTSDPEICREIISHLITDVRRSEAR